MLILFPAQVYIAFLNVLSHCRQSLQIAAKNRFPNCHVKLTGQFVRLIQFRRLLRRALPRHFSPTLEKRRNKEAFNFVAKIKYIEKRERKVRLKESKGSCGLIPPFDQK